MVRSTEKIAAQLATGSHAHVLTLGMEAAAAIAQATAPIAPPTQHQLKPDIQDVKGYKAGSDHIPVNGLPREQLGFPDGISQPLLEGTMVEPATGQPVIRTGDFIMSYLNAYNVYANSPSVPAEADPDHILPIFPEDAAPECRDLGRNGTYLVYRKLEEHVASFWQFIQKNAEWNVSGADPKQQRLKHTMNWLATKCMGRWTSGAPIAMAPDYDNPFLGADNHRNNNFVYQPEDIDGWPCPVGSHIRRSNPRDSLAHNSSADSFSSVNRHRLLRRSIHFGSRWSPTRW